MILHLIRKQFIDRWWDAADLDAAAEFWLRLYEESARANGFTYTPVHHAEIRLRGFPRHTANNLLKELANRVAVSDFPAPEVDLPDPDTLVLASGDIRGEEQAPAGLGLPVLASEAFDGLLVEIRFRVIGDEGKMLRKVKVESTLVLVGELRGGRFLLKGAWQVGSLGWEDKLAWAGGWLELDNWLTAFDEFRESGEVPTALAKKLFVIRGAERIGALVVKMIHVPLDKPRLGGLLARVVVFALLLGLLGLAAWWIISTERWFFFLLWLGFTWPVLWVLKAFVSNEWRMWTNGFRDFHDGYARLYTEPIRHVAVMRAEAEAKFDNPYLRKYTADLEAAGFRYAGDMQLVPSLIGEAVFRVFYAPDGISYMVVMFHLAGREDADPRFRSWPAALAFMAHTYYADGGLVTSVNGRHVGYRKKRTGPEHLARLFPDEDDPVAFVRLHTAAAQRFATETSRRPLPHQPFEFFIRRQEELQEEERRLFADEPYTRGDHLRWYLQTPRKEYRG